MDTIAVRKAQIWERLPKLTGSDWNSIDREIETKIKNGWTDNEIVQFCNCTEEVQPDLEESVALRRMYLIQNNVKTRQQKDNKNGWLIGRN